MRVRSALISLAIIVIWLVFGVGYLQRFRARRPPAQPVQEEGVSAEGERETSVAGDAIEARLAPDDRAIRPDMLCLNTSAVDDPAWTDVGFQRALFELHLGSMRIPGGAVSGYWDWRSGELAPGPDWPDVTTSANNLDTYLAGFAATKATPVFVLNMLNADLADQLGLLEQAQAGGLPIRYVELGHALNAGGHDSAARRAFPDGEAYVNIAVDWAETIRRTFPGANVALVGARPSRQMDARQANWNRAVFAAAGAEGLSLSFYPYAESSINQETELNPAQVRRVLGTPFVNWENFKTHLEESSSGGLGREINLWFTEYNLLEPAGAEPQVNGTWAQTLNLVNQSLLFLGDERVELMCPHVLTGPRQWAALVEADDGYLLTPTGLAVQQLGRAMTGMSRATTIEFTHVPFSRGSQDSEYPTLLGWRFSDASDGQTALIVNLSADAREVTLEPAGDFPVQFQKLLSSPTQRVRGSDGLETLTGSVDDGRLTLPPFSITSLSR